MNLREEALDYARNHWADYVFVRLKFNVKKKFLCKNINEIFNSVLDSGR